MQQSLKPGQYDEDRFDRSKRIGWIDMDSLSEARCLVVGAGALGNKVVKDLALSGFRNITIVDMDRVVRSNLNRCIFFREELGERTAEGRDPSRKGQNYRFSDQCEAYCVENRGSR